MNTEFWLSEILFFIVYSIALLVLREFVISKDGMLRKLMIAYFIVEFYTYFGAAVYYLGVHEKWITLRPETYRVIIATPKVCVKLCLLWWLVKNRQKRKGIE